MATPIISGFSIDTFKSQFGNAARQSLFYVAVLPPASVTYMTETKMVYLVRSSTIPGWQVEKKELGWQGYRMPVGGPTTHDDWTCTFLVDTQALIYKTMVAWKNLVHDPATNAYGDPATYMTGPQVIQQLSLDGTSTIQTINLIGAFPINVGPIELNYDSTDFSTFQVTFAFVRHEIVS